LDPKLATHTARITGVVAVILAFAACVPICGIGAKFALSNARVDPQYNCPYPSSNHPYDVHSSVDASNTLSSIVTIKSIKEEDLLVNTVGDWNGAKGVKGTGNITDYTPKSVASGANATIKFSIPFVCTSSGPSVTTYGEFSFKFTFVTSAGAYAIDSSNHHRLNFPKV
jgi:hypothetical protein